MSNFGALTNHFSDLIDLTSITQLKLIDSSKTPTPRNRADANDAENDVAAATWFGATDIFDISCTYLLKGSTLAMNTLKLGEIVAGTAVASISAATSNTQWPRITITGRTGLETMAAIGGTPAKLNTFTLPALTLTGAKRAQPLGFTVGADGRLTGCSFEATAEIAEETDGVGEPCAHGISGAVGTVNADFVRVTGAPTWALTLSGLTSTQEPGANEGQAAYHTTPASAEIVIARDTAA
jgi:hypothetical protein